MKRYIIVLSLIFLALPQAAFAVPVQCPAGAITTDGIFDPNAQVPSGYGSGSNSFGGLNFSGVGGALAGCLNVGGFATSSLKDLFGSGAKSAASSVGISTGGQSVPVADSAVNTQLSKINEREQCLNGVANAAAKSVLQSFTTKTINWAKTGFDGNPFYVRDIDSYMKSIRDEKVSSFLQDVPNADPVFGIALRSIITEQVTGFTDGRLTQIMNTPEAREYEAFQNDFTQGGWNAFLNPRNNAVGAYFNAVDRLSSIVDTAKQNVRDELVQGNGFLSMKKCAEYATNRVAPNGTTDKASCIAEYNTDKASEAATCATRATQILKDGCMQSVNTKYEGLLANCDTAFTDTSGFESTGNSNRCLRYETVTPGALISNQVSAVLNSPINQSIAADSINEVVGGFFDSMLNNLFSKGLGSLGRSRGSTLSGQNVVYDSSGNVLPGVAEALSIEGVQSSCIDNGYAGDFDISRPQQLRAIIQTQKDYLNRINDNALAAADIVPALGKLDYCIPGPNPTWKDGLDENFQTFLSSFRVDSKTLNGPLGLFSSTSVAFVADASLFDKAKSQYHQIRNFTFSGQGSGSFLGIGGTGQTLDSLDAFLKNGYNTLLSLYTATYNPASIATAFGAVVPVSDRATAIASINESFKETKSLSAYGQIIPQYQLFYSQSDAQSRSNIAELESINAEVLQIVATAKARYLRDHPEVASAINPKTGNRCIDDAYIVNTTPITGAARQRTNSILPATDIPYSKASNDYFYNTL
jgi:hypothetical protein